MSVYVVPTYILDEIEQKLDEQIAIVPAAEKDRETLRGQLLEFVNEHGVVPEFSLVKQ